MGHLTSKRRGGKKRRAQQMEASVAAGVPESVSPEAVVEILEGVLDALREERKALWGTLEGRGRTPHYWGLVGAINALGTVLRVVRARAAGPHGKGAVGQ